MTAVMRQNGMEITHDMTDASSGGVCNSYRVENRVRDSYRVENGVRDSYRVENGVRNTCRVDGDILVARAPDKSFFGEVGMTRRKPAG